MNKLEKKLIEIKKNKKIGLMTHAIIGYPSLPETISLVKTMAKYADMVELQIPFSDPLADGSTIMKACEVALQNGTKVKDAFALMKKLSKEIAIPLIFMAYYNTVFKYGVEKFIREVKNAGCSGLIIPDMPIEEEPYENFFKLAKAYDIPVIHVVSPASTDDRLQKNAKLARGFVYATARQGTTGTKKDLGSQTLHFLKRVKKYFSIPIAVGFGISEKSQIQKLIGFADMAIVGSAILRKVQNKENLNNFLNDLSMIK